MIYDISYRAFIGAKPFCIRLDKIDGFIRVYDGSRYLLLFVTEKYDAKYLFSHYYAKIKVDFYYSFPLENTLTLYVIIHIQAVFNKDQNHY